MSTADAAEAPPAPAAAAPSAPPAVNDVVAAAAVPAADAAAAPPPPGAAAADAKAPSSDAAAASGASNEDVQPPPADGTGTVAPSVSFRLKIGGLWRVGGRVQVAAAVWVVRRLPGTVYATVVLKLPDWIPDFFYMHIFCRVCFTHRFWSRVPWCLRSCIMAQSCTCTAAKGCSPAVPCPFPVALGRFQS